MNNTANKVLMKCLGKDKSKNNKREYSNKEYSDIMSNKYKMVKGVDYKYGKCDVCGKKAKICPCFGGTEWRCSNCDQ